MRSLATGVVIVVYIVPRKFETGKMQSRATDVYFVPMKCQTDRMRSRATGAVSVVYFVPWK